MIVACLRQKLLAAHDDISTRLDWKLVADGITGNYCAARQLLWIAPSPSSTLIGRLNFLPSPHWSGQSGLLQVGKIITTEILMTSSDSWSDLGEKEM